MMNPTNSELPDIPDGFPHDFKLKRRAYLHFDAPISPTRAKSLILDPARVASHSFLPFLTRELRTPRYKKDENRVRDKVRGIALSSHCDAAIYQYYNYIINKYYELLLPKASISDAPTAYRRFHPGKCNIHFASDAFAFIRDHQPAVVVCCDIKGFFDNLNHALLYKTWCQVLDVERLPLDHYKVFRSLTKYASASEIEVKKLLGITTQSREELQHRLCSPSDLRDKIRAGGLIHTNVSGCGVPQGSPISGLLSNIYMIPFDIEIQDFASEHGGFFRRYSDDIFLALPIGPTGDKEELLLLAERKMNDAIARVKLEIQKEKVDFYHCYNGISGTFVKPVQYLGLSFDGKDIRIRHQTLSRYYGRLFRYIKRSKKAALKNPLKPGIYRSKLLRKYTHFGRQNFIDYAFRCARICNSPAVKKQVANHMKVIRRHTALSHPTTELQTE